MTEEKKQNLPKKVFNYLIVKTIVPVVILIIVLSLLSDDTDFFEYNYLFFIALLMGSCLYLYLWWKSVSFVVSEKEIKINSGIFIKKSKSISFQSVQTVEVVKGPISAMFGLAVLEIWTASPGQKDEKTEKRDPDGSITVNIEDAEEIRDIIMNNKE